MTNDLERKRDKSSSVFYDRRHRWEGRFVGQTEYLSRKLRSWHALLNLSIESIVEFVIHTYDDSLSLLSVSTNNSNSKEPKHSYVSVVRRNSERICTRVSTGDSSGSFSWFEKEVSSSESPFLLWSLTFYLLPSVEQKISFSWITGSWRNKKNLSHTSYTFVLSIFSRSGLFYEITDLRFSRILFYLRIYLPRVFQFRVQEFNYFKWVMLLHVWKSN
jgi:hypothetical protein